MIHTPYLDLDVAPCNYTCVACNHFAPWGGLSWMSLETLRQDLARLRPLIRADKITLLGGEPTLHPGLLDLLRVTRAAGIARQVGVTTNGSRLHLMPDDFWGLVDVLYISAYPKAVGGNIELARRRQQRYGFELGVVPVAFSRVLTAQPLSPAAAQVNYDRCPFRGYCRAIYHGYFYQCFAAHAIPGRFMDLAPAVDGLKIDADLTEDRMQAYLNQPTPLNACRRCSYRKQFIPWREAESEAEWVRESTEQ